MDGYTKLFGSIVASSIWGEDHPTRIVWVTMMALADKNGYVGASISGLARAAVVTNEECTAALAKFMAPDPDSRSDAFEGRRIETVDRGWRLLNHEKLRNLRSQDDRSEQNRESQRKYRANHPKSKRQKRVINSKQKSAQASPSPSPSADTEEERETRAPASEAVTETRPVSRRPPLQDEPANVQEAREPTFIERASKRWNELLTEKYREAKGVEPVFEYDSFSEHMRWRVFEEHCERTAAKVALTAEVVGAQVLAEYFARTRTTYDNAGIRWVNEDFQSLAQRSDVLRDLAQRAKLEAS